MPLDGVVVPGLLLWLAADHLIRGPSSALAWRLLHDPELAAPPAWLRPWLPGGAPFDRDPLALLLAGGATGLAVLYLGAALVRAAPGRRAALLAAAVALLVLLPSGLYMSVGFVTGRPFGQDGGVVQLPLALERLLARESPYGADYSDSMLGKQSRASAFWRGYGGNPILRHHAYLPGTHLVMLPAYLASRAAGFPFDPRTVTLLALALAAWLAAGFFDDAERRLAAAGLVALNPLVHWHQVFGANDILFVAMLLGCARLFLRGRNTWAGALLGLACATKQLAWPFAPFLLLHAAGARDFRGLLSASAWARLRWPLLAAAIVLVAVIGPVAALDLRAFYGDIVAYNLGIGGDRYPLGGTPGFGLANFVLYAGGVRSLRDPFPLGLVSVVVLPPLLLLLVCVQLRRGGVGAAFAAGGAALLATLYFSRVAHANYLSAVATLLPVGVLLGAASADTALVPLLLLGLATTVVERGVFRWAWLDAVAAGLPDRLSGLAARLAPESGALTDDPLGLAIGATAALLALGYACLGIVGVRVRARGALVVVAVLTVVVLPLLVVAGIGAQTGMPRAQDGVRVQARFDAARLAGGRSPYAPPLGEAPLGREAWTTSFRLEPPAALTPQHPLVPPGAAAWLLLLRPLATADGCVLTLLALLLLLVSAALAVPAERRPFALAVAGLLPPLALGAIFGSGELWWLSLLVAAFVAARRGWPRAAGLLAGGAIATDLHALPMAALLPLALAVERRRDALERSLPAAALVFCGVLLPVAWLDAGAVLEAFRRTGEVGPGVGLVDLASYDGLESAFPIHVALALAPLAVTAFLLWSWRRQPAGAVPLGGGALALLILLFFDRQASVFALSPPLVLLALSAVAAPRADPQH